MLTQSQLSALHRAHRDERMLSVYVDGSIPDPAGQRTWRLHLDRAIKDLQTWLDGSARVEREDLDSCTELLEAELAKFDPTVGAPGWVAFITKSGVVHAQPVPVPVATLAVWSNGACVAPYLRALTEARPVIVAVVDARKAELYRYQFGWIDRVETLRAHHIVEPASHMGAAVSQGFHSGTRGTPGHDASQAGLLESRDRMLDEAGQRAVELAGPAGWILVGGIPRVAARFEESVAAAAPGRVLRIDHLDVHSSEAIIADAARAGATTMRDALDVQRVTTIIDRAGAGGLGALGTADIRKALTMESVHELLVTHTYLDDHAADAEEAVRAAFDQGAAVEEISGRAAELLDAKGGIGAELRFLTKPQEEPRPKKERPARPHRRRRTPAP
jgi:release factor family 10